MTKDAQEDDDDEEYNKNKDDNDGDSDIVEDDKVFTTLQNF